MSTHDLVAPASDRGDLGAGDGSTPGEGQAVPASPAPAPLYAEEEFESLITSVWALGGVEDLTRFDDLLNAALVFIGTIAFRPDSDPADAARAASILRSMEQRALWGPDYPVRQP